MSDGGWSRRLLTNDHFEPTWSSEFVGTMFDRFCLFLSDADAVLLHCVLQILSLRRDVHFHRSNASCNIFACNQEHENCPPTPRSLVSSRFT